MSRKKKEIEIPVGYRRLNIGEIVKAGDLWLNESSWALSVLSGSDVGAKTVYIRKGEAPEIHWSDLFPDSLEPTKEAEK